MELESLIKRRKSVMVSPTDILSMLTRYQRGQYLRGVKISREDVAGAEVINVFYDPTRAAFYLVLVREDWPEVPPGESVEVLGAGPLSLTQKLFKLVVVE